MARYVIEKGGYAINVILSDSAEVANQIAATQGATARLLGENETPHYAPVIPLPNYVITRFSFLKRIGRANRKDIRASADVNVIDGWDLLKSADLIDVRDDAVIEAVDAWRTANILNMARRNAILDPE
jgi:hypothetical protein